jgi:hypothetical protein
MGQHNKHPVAHVLVVGVPGSGTEAFCRALIRRPQWNLAKHGEDEESKREAEEEEKSRFSAFPANLDEFNQVYGSWLPTDGGSLLTLPVDPQHRVF